MVRLMRGQVAVATAVAVGVAWALWSGCGGGSGSGSPDAGRHNGVPTVKPGVDAAEGAPLPDAPAPDGAPYPGAEACPGWPGWYRAPGLPKGCFSACVPDHPRLRIPALKWTARDDWCPGCKRLETSWWPDPRPQDRPALQYVRGFGPGPDFVYLVMRHPGEINVIVVYDSRGYPVVALGGGQQNDCGAAALTVGQDRRTVAMTYRDAGLTHQRWLLRPVNRAAELLTASQPDFSYPDGFAGNDFSEGSWLTADWIVDEFTGFLALADVKTGTAVKVDALPGALPGEYDSAVFAGSAVFVEHFTNKTDWMIVENGVLKPFLGGADVDIDRFATDGKWIVWNEGSQLTYDPKNPNWLVSGRYDLYRSPFTTDPAKLQRQLLVPGTWKIYGISTLANGHFTGIFYANAGSAAPLRGDALVVDVSTGRAWTSELPGSYSWGKQNFPTPTELWGTIAPGGYDEYASAIVRVPYADMKQIQTGLP